jgi:hypothetical protein
MNLHTWMKVMPESCGFKPSQNYESFYRHQGDFKLFTEAQTSMIRQIVTVALSQANKFHLMSRSTDSSNGICLIASYQL